MAKTLDYLGSMGVAFVSKSKAGRILKGMSPVKGKVSWWRVPEGAKVYTNGRKGQKRAYAYKGTDNAYHLVGHDKAVIDQLFWGR